MSRQHRAEPLTLSPAQKTEIEVPFSGGPQYSKTSCWAPPLKATALWTTSLIQGPQHCRARPGHTLTQSPLAAMPDDRAEQGKDEEKKNHHDPLAINVLASGPKLSGG